jgi:hypothetical protein
MKDCNPEVGAVHFSNIDNLLQSIADLSLDNYHHENLRSYQQFSSRLANVKPCMEVDHKQICILYVK